MQQHQQQLIKLRFRWLLSRSLARYVLVKPMM